MSYDLSNSPTVDMLSVKAGPAPVLQGGPALSDHEQPEPQVVQETSTLFVAALTRDRWG